MFMLFELNFLRELQNACEMISVCWPNFTSSAFHYFEFFRNPLTSLRAASCSFGCGWNKSDLLLAILIQQSLHGVAVAQCGRVTQRHIIGNLSSNYEWSLIRTKVFLDSLPHNQHSTPIQWSCRKATHVESNPTVMNTAAGLSVISNRCFKKLW